MIAKGRNVFYSRLIISAFIAVMVVLFVSLAAVPSAFAYDNEELAFLTYINNHRQAYGLAPLTLSTTIYNASEGHSYDMGARNYFSHNTPEGVTPWDRIRAAGYTYNTYLGENIAAGYGTAESVFVAWRDSPEHNANMLSANFRAIGIGRYYVAGSTYGWYWTTDFGGVSDTVVVPVPIDATLVGKWNALNGGPGAAVNMAQTITGGKFQDFINGRLVWNESTNEVYWVHGAILTKYDQLGKWNSFLGMPIGDEGDVSGVTGARKSEFTGGTVYWGPGVGTYSITAGPIMTRYLAAPGGGPAAFGLPVSDMYNAWNGKAQNMQRATLTWDGTANPAYAVYGGILVKYNMLGGPTGALHLATGEEMDVLGVVPGVTGARVSNFQNGNVYWSLVTGSHTVNGGVYVRYTAYCDPGTSKCGPNSRLGLPITDEYPIALPGGAARSQFQHGFVTWWALYGTWIDVM